MEDINRSRNIILKMLNLRNFETDQYNNISDIELNILYEKKNLNFKVKHKTENRFLYVKYLIDSNKNPNKSKFESILDSAFSENNDENYELMFILPEDDKENVLQNICNKYCDLYKKFSQVFYIKKITIDITKHQNVPEHTLLTKDEENELISQYKINKKNLPYININDPVAKFLGIKKNQIVKIIRPSINAGETCLYRLCVNKY